jgi:cell division septum initiation protein DivIVA
MATDSSGPIDPDRILEKTFATVKRGVDPVEVQRYLLQISNQLKSAQQRVLELERQIDEARRRSAEHDPIDPSNLTKLLGEETTRVLDAAQSAAAEIRAKAEESVARLLREAREESVRMREETELLVTRRRQEAEQAAAQIYEESEQRLADAQAEAAGIIEASKQEGREMVVEAQQVRQRMLDDLSRRRQGLRQQIEQLQAGRDRLSAAYDVVRETLAVATEELQVALPEARLAAEVVQLQGADEELGATVTPIVTAEDLGEPTIDAAPLPPARNVETPPEPKSAAPKLTVVPPVDDSTPEDQTPSTPGSEATEGADLAVVSEPGDVPIDSEVSTSAAEPTPTAPDPREGRHSSSVRVVRTSSGKAADVFARLRQEGEDETALVDDTPANAAPVEVTAPEDATQVDTESFDEESASQENTSAVETQIESIDADADADQAFIVTRNEAVASIESALARRMKRELSDEQNELLSTLRSIKGNLTAIAFLPTPESQLERYEDIALPALADAAEAGGTISPVKGRSSSRASVGDLAAELASAIVGPLRDRLERAVSESAGDRDDLAQRIRSTFREWKGQRVDDAVSFAVLSACNRGILDRIPKSAQIRWVVAVDDPASPDCEDNALGGPIEHGQEFPTGHKVPPLHPGCHCVVLPSS